jgi:hypothetical protein
MAIHRLFGNRQWAGRQWAGRETRGPTAAASSFAVATPAALPANHAGDCLVALAGTGTAWDGSTVFALSGVAIDGLSGVTVNSPTSAVLRVATKPSLATSAAGPTGTLVVSDGTAQATVEVVAVALAVTPNHGNVHTTPAVALAGVGTVWVSTDLGAGTFSVTGGAGASTGTPAFTSDTAASAVLTVGSAVGTLTVRDLTTGATATFRAGPAAARSGSVKVRIPSDRRRRNTTTEAPAPFVER